MTFSIQHNSMAATATRNLRAAGFTMGKAMEKLSSGYRINTAADGPADLIESERLRARIEGLERAIRNTNETGNVLDITDGALGEIGGILRNMSKLAIHSMNAGVTTAEQTAADQAEMDGALQSIDRIINTTNYAGRKLLDNLNLGSGAGGHVTIGGKSLADAAGAAAGEGTGAGDNGGGLKTFSRGGAAGADGLLLNSAGKPAVNTSPLVDEAGLLLTDKTFTVSGADGGNGDSANQTTLHFAAGTSLTDIVSALRGRTLTQEEADGLDPAFAAPAGRQGSDIDSVGMSLDTLAHVQRLGDSAAAEFVKDYMTNFTPQSPLTAKAMDVSGLSEGGRKLLSLSRDLTDMSTDSLGGVTVSGGFDKNGSEIFRTLSLADIYSGGRASLAASPDAALKVIKQAGNDVLAMRANIAATRAYSLTASENMLLSELEGSVRAESFLRDTDMAKGMVEFARSKLVSQVGTEMLSAAMNHPRAMLDLFA